MVSNRLAWPLVGGACAVIVAGVALMWRFQGPSIGISVGIPVGATLLAPLVAWAISAQPRARQSTREQLESAKQALAGRVLEQWKGLARPAETDAILRASINTLPVRWAASTPGRLDAADRAGTAGVVTMAARLRQQQSRRLIILGDAGSGKTVLARLLIAELLAHPLPSDPVPVFLPLAEWNPECCPSLCEWMVRQIGKIAPELHGSSYGPTAVPSLVARCMVLPVLDGLDALPESSRQAVLASEDFLLQDRLVLTSRTPQFADAAKDRVIGDAVVFTPGRVRWAEAIRFLRATADRLYDWDRPPDLDRPRDWDCVAEHVRADPSGPLGRALSVPRILYLASAVYQDDRNNPRDLTAEAGDVESYLLSKLVPVPVAADGSWAQQWPQYGDRARGWLRFLAESISDPDSGRITWQNVIRAAGHSDSTRPAVRALARWWLPIVRALIPSVLAFLAVIILVKGLYGVLTGLSYSLAIIAACVPALPPLRQRPPTGAGEPAAARWIGRAWARQRPRLVAGLAAFLGYGSMIWLRNALLALPSHPGEAAIRALTQGLVGAMAVVLTAVIAGIPAAPRSRLADQPAGRAAGPAAGLSSARRATWISIARALGLGISFGLLAGSLTVFSHQSAHDATTAGLGYGLVVGLNFAAGAWLVSLVRARLISGGAPDPRSALRAERTFTLLAIVIVGLTFASAFGLSPYPLRWHTSGGGIRSGLIGIFGGSLASEYPLYPLAIVFFARRKKLPLRLTRFLELSRAQGILRPLQGAYQFREDPLATLAASDHRGGQHPDSQHPGRPVPGAPAAAPAAAAGDRSLGGLGRAELGKGRVSQGREDADVRG